ncbi:hypothetical protein [Candidatus Palauibacter sp.]|uniref:hypothetical protein n=1 Tax=Candidatus Palauibacter sp. TaxID=3101350 RepID=UPI003B020329
MTGFALFGGILLVLLITIIWAAIRAGEDTGAALGAAERRDAAIEALRDLELEYRGQAARGGVRDPARPPGANGLLL